MIRQLEMKSKSGFVIEQLQADTKGGTGSPPGTVSVRTSGQIVDIAFRSVIKLGKIERTGILI